MGNCKCVKRQNTQQNKPDLGAAAMSTIGFVGAGNMAEALIKGIIAANIYACHQVFVSDIRSERVIFVANKYGLVMARTNVEVAERAENRRLQRQASEYG